MHASCQIWNVFLEYPTVQVTRSLFCSLDFFSSPRPVPTQPPLSYTDQPCFVPIPDTLFDSGGSNLLPSPSNALLPTGSASSPVLSSPRLQVCKVDGHLFFQCSILGFDLVLGPVLSFCIFQPFPTQPGFSIGFLLYQDSKGIHLSISRNSQYKLKVE